jgi:hypothetical protein
LSGGTGITSTVSAATKTLFTSLVSNNLWDKLIVFYPMIGGNAQGICIEAKSRSTYNLQFNGGWTFNSSGCTPNGTNGYASTFVNDSTLQQNNKHISVYSRTNVDGNACDMGVFDGAALVDSGTHMFPRLSGGLYFRNSDAGSSDVASSFSNGYYVNTRDSSTTRQGYRNGTQLFNRTINSKTQVNSNHFLGALNNINAGGPVSYSTRQLCFATIGYGLTSGETATLSTIINTFQTSLGRNTY